MDKIKAMREKFAMPNEEELDTCFNTSFHNMKESLRTQDDHLFESQTKIQQLKSELREIDDSIAREKELLHSRILELSAAEESVKELKADKNDLLQELHQLELKRNELRNIKPNAKDQQTIDTGLEKFKNYKQLTGIRWDFGAPKETAKGYITNGTDYVHSFNYNKSEHGRNLEDLLWKEIETAAERKADSEGIEEKEVPDD